MLAYLARPDVIDTLRAGEQPDDRELSTIRDQLATVRARHDELADAVGAGTLSVVLAARSEPTLCRGTRELLDHCSVDRRACDWLDLTNGPVTPR